MRITVIGLGLIGGSLALDLKKRGFAAHVTGVDANAEHAATAKKLRLVDSIVPLPAALSQSDLVILAIPVGQIVKLLPDILAQIPPTTTVTDMGSTKATICAAIADHPRRKNFVASHPMAGTENSGPEAALTGLFDLKTAVVCDRDESGPEHLKRIEALYAALKMRLIFMTAKEHDLHTAFVSHLSHISSFVLANTVLSQEKNTRTIFDLAGGGFESTVRLAKSSPAMWLPIFEHNLANVTQAVGAYIEHLQEFHRALQSPHARETVALMENANQIRPVLANIGSRKETPAQ